MSKRILYLILVCLSINCDAQTSTIDSLKRILKVCQQDTTKVNILNEMSTALNAENDFYQSRTYAEEALLLAKALQFKQGEANTNRILGRIQKKLGNHPQAIKHFIESLKLYESLEDKKNIAGAYNNIGTVYLEQLNYDEALNYMQKALSIFKEIKDTKWIHNTYTNIGNIFIDKGNYKDAQTNYITALAIRKELNDEKGMAASYNNLGLVYQAEKKYNEAVEHFNRSLILAIKSNYKSGIANAYYNIAITNIARGQFANVAEYINKSLAICLESKNIDGIKECYSGFALLDSATGNYKSSLENYKKYIQYKDSLINESNSEKIIQQQMQYDFDKKELIVKATQLKKDEQAKRRNILVYAGFGGLFLLGVFGFFLNKQKQRAKRILEIEQMKSSISRDLHDDIGSTLSSISMQTEVITSRLTKKENITDIITNINFISKDMMSKMSDIVWSLNLSSDKTEHLLDRIENYCVHTLSPNQIEFQLIYDDEIKQIEIPSTTLKEMYLIVKEAINNSLKHASCRTIDIVFKKNNNQLNMEVHDDGIGFDISQKKSNLGGEGLKNMKIRATKINATIAINSTKEQGTSTTVSIPL